MIELIPSFFVGIRQILQEADMFQEPDEGKAHPSALKPEELARLLTRVGGKPVAPAVIHLDIAAGAPTNATGTMNLIHYASWLVREEASRAD